MAKDKPKVVTCEGRFAFPYLVVPEQQDDKPEPQYATIMLFDRDADLSSVRDLCKQTAVDAWGPDKSKWPKGYISPIKDADEEGKDWDGFPGKMYIRAASKFPPALFGARKDAKTGRPVALRDEFGNVTDEGKAAFYGGAWGRLQVGAYAWSYKGKNGISLNLYAAQKTRDDEPFGNGFGTDAPDGFDAVDGADDPKNYQSGGVKEGSPDEF